MPKARLLTLSALVAAGCAMPGCWGGGGSDSAQEQDQALTPIEAGRERRPRDPAVEAVARGAMLRERGLEDTALAEFVRAIELNPELVSAQIGAGEILMDRGDYETSARYFRNAARLEPGSFDAQYGLAQSLQLQGRVADSVDVYRRALNITPTNVEANLNLAGALLSLDRAGEAEEPALRAVAVEPDSGPARLALAAAYDGQGRFEDAIVEYRQAAELIDLSADILLQYSEALARVGRLEEGEQVLEQLMRLEPSAPGFERLGATRFRLRQYDASLDAYRMALEIDPDYYPALNGVGVNMLNRYLWSDRTDVAALREARAALQRSLQVERKQPKIVELLTRYR